MKSRYLRLFIGFLLILLFSLFFLQKINLTTADLGRHITNGEVFVRFGKVVSTNYYSYTEPDFPVVTHHWLSGVIFYLVKSAVGFNGLSLFYGFISGLTVFIFFLISKRRSNFVIALFFTLLLIPLMANRKEIRPEGFSYLFLGFYVLLYDLYYSKNISFKVLLIALVVSQILWVNLHIFFIMGIFISGVFLFVEILKGKKNSIKNHLIILLSLIIASLVNPYGFAGLIEPLNIFKEYEYMIIENQSIFFMQKRIPQFMYFAVELVSVIFVGVAAHLATDKRRFSYLGLIIISFVFMVLSFRAIRGIPMFAMFLAPVLSLYVFEKLPTLKNKLTIPLMIVSALMLIPNSTFSFMRTGFGTGIIDGVNRSADFVKDNNIVGPVFNNYDIGGFMIYNFFEKLPVFVDNRPEAYSAEFFKNVYGPAQADNNYWNELDAKYNFNLIYFYRHDATQYAQPFLIERIKDDNWIPVYVDNYVLILIKNNEANRELIEKYKLPKEMFVITKV